MKASLKAGRISSLLNPLTYAIVNVAILFILWFGGIRVNAGDLSQGEVIAFINYMTQILLALIVARQSCGDLYQGSRQRGED